MLNLSTRKSAYDCYNHWQEQVSGTMIWRKSEDEFERPSVIINKVINYNDYEQSEFFACKINV